MSNLQGPTKKKAVLDQSIPVKDRIQATIRNPQYLVDWGTYNKNLMDYISNLPDHQRPREEDCLPDGPEDNPVAKRWNLPFPEHPFISPRQSSYYSNGIANVVVTCSMNGHHAILIFECIWRLQFKTSKRMC